MSTTKKVPKGVMVYGHGKLGEAVLVGLDKLGVKLYQFAYNGPCDDIMTNTYGKQIVTIVDSSELKNISEQGYKKVLLQAIHRTVSHIIVTLPGKILEQDIDFLLRLGIPLIICSTGYNENIIRQKTIKAGVTVVMSQNMVLTIIALWNIIKNLQKAPGQIRVYLRESHQPPKADVSGSGVTTLELCREKDFIVDFDKSAVEFEKGKDGSCGCFTWLREEESQIYLGVPEEFLDGHGYHTFRFECPCSTSQELDDYMRDFYDSLKELEKDSVEGVFKFHVSLTRRGIVVTHNINGRGIYPFGIYECMKHADVSDVGVYSGIDVVNAKTTE